MSTDHPANPFAALGLPPTWVPAPITWQFGSLEMLTDAGVERVRVVLFDTPTGRVGLAFPADTLRAFATQAMEQCTGLTIANGGIGSPPNGRPT